jgi:cell division protein FtsQ
MVLAVLAGTCLWVTYWSPWLTVRTIEVSGLQTLSREQVLAAAAIELDRPLARLDPSAVRSRVEALPRVRLAQVHRHWPRTVALTVVERQAAAVVRVGRSYRLVDPDGVAFATVATRPAAVPVVVTARQAQSSAEPSAAALRAAIEVLGALPPAVSERVTAVSAGTPDAITLGLAGGVTVMWGSAEASARKAEVLGALMRLKAKVYDVSAPDAPTTR